MGAREEARGKKGEGVVDWGKGCTEDARDLPNDDITTTLQDDLEGCDTFRMNDSTFARFSGPALRSRSVVLPPRPLRSPSRKRH